MIRSTAYFALLLLALASVLLPGCSQAPSPAIVPTVPPTVAPTKAPAAPADPLQALAAAKQTTEIFVDSFETGTPGEFAVGWNILDKDNHVANKSGQRIADATVKAPDGKLAVKMISNDGVDGKMNRDFVALPRGRLVVYGMVPDTNCGYLSVELRDGAKRLFSLEMHPEGRFRYRDDATNNQESNVAYKFDTWYQLILEWDANYNVWQGYFKDESGKQVKLTPEKGVQFSKEAPGVAPTRIEVRLNKATPPKVGYVDSFKLYKLD